VDLQALKATIVERVKQDQRNKQGYSARQSLRLHPDSVEGLQARSAELDVKTGTLARIFVEVGLEALK